jgi:NitT/TauT family transport system permease protein
MTAIATPPLAPVTARKEPSPGRLRRLLTSPGAARITALIVFLVGWELVARSADSILIPTPTAVADKFVEFLTDGTVFEHFGISLARLATGFTVVVVVGTTVGVLMGVSKYVEAYLHDFVVMGITFPYIIWAFLLTMWVGYGSQGPVWVVVLAATPYVISNVATGVKDVPKELLDMSRAYGIGRTSTLRNVVLPSLGPFFFAALRYSLSTGWKALISAEVFAAESGAGYHMVDIRRIGDSAGIVAWALYFVIFAITVERGIFVPISRWVFRWRPAEARQRRRLEALDEAGLAKAGLAKAS